MGYYPFYYVVRFVDCIGGREFWLFRCAFKRMCLIFLWDEHEQAHGEKVFVVMLLMVRVVLFKY